MKKNLILLKNKQSVNTFSSKSTLHSKFKNLPIDGKPILHLIIITIYPAPPENPLKLIYQDSELRHIIST